MARIGMTELHIRTAEVLRRVREDHDEFIVTDHGQPVALLLPILPDREDRPALEAARPSPAGGWDAYARLATTLRERWPGDSSTDSVLGEIRR